MSVRRIFWAAAFFAALALVAYVALTAATTHYSRSPQAYVGRPGDPRPPAWSRPCRRYDARYRVRYVRACGRAQGRVVYRQSDDPDGDGDAHLLVVAGRRLVIVKLDPPAERRPALPGIGDRVDVVGTVDHGRMGLTELDARRQPSQRRRRANDK